MINEVVVLDDDPVHNFICERIIAKNRFSESCKCFETPSDALMYLQEKSVKNENMPEVLLVDFVLPEMDGMEFIERFKKIKGAVNCRIFILTTLLEQDQISSQDTSGHEFCNYYSKPLNDSVLSLIKTSLTSGFPESNSSA